jgi:hypothetical protein
MFRHGHRWSRRYRYVPSRRLSRRIGNAADSIQRPAMPHDAYGSSILCMLRLLSLSSG